MPSDMANIDLSPTSACQGEAGEERGQPFTWDVETFYRAIRAGVFENSGRLELIEGEILETLPAQETPHIQAVHLCAEELRAFREPICHVRTQSPLAVGRNTEPEPDVMVIRGSLRDYDQRKPKPEDVLLLVEISDTTLGYDRGRKMSLYAEAGVEEYWVVNLRTRILEVRRTPCPGHPRGFGYSTYHEYSPDAKVAPAFAPEVDILVAALLPSLNEGETG